MMEYMYIFRRHLSCHSNLSSLNLDQQKKGVMLCPVEIPCTTRASQCRYRQPIPLLALQPDIIYVPSNARAIAYPACPLRALLLDIRLRTEC